VSDEQASCSSARPFSMLGAEVRIIDVGLASTRVRESGNVPTVETIIDSGHGVTLSLLA